MLPLKLTIEGLYAYQERQIIDFEDLTSVGLFGIFGAVGSGKSSILEAISFVLYGNTDRLLSSDKRSYNMLNLKSSQAFISFEFKISDDRIYKFTAQWKRRKNYTDTTTIERNAYLKKDEEWLPLEHKNATEILGLTYENFTKTIIIPQGKFKEFLELGSTDRTRMLEDIFNLKKYDLYESAKRLQNENKELLLVNEGNLKQYEDYLPECLPEREEALQTQQKVVENLKIQLQNHLLKFEKQRVVKAQYEALSMEEEVLKELITQQLAIDNETKHLQQYEYAVLHFREAIAQTKLLEEDFYHNNTQFEKAKEHLTNAEKLLERQHSDYEVITPQFIHLEADKKQLEDYRTLQKISSVNGAVLQLEERVQKGIAYISKEERGLDKVLKAVQQQEDEIKVQKRLKLDTTLMLTVSSWYQVYNRIQLSQKELKEKIHHFENQIQQNKHAFTTLNVSFDNWKSVISKELQHLSKCREENEILLQQLAVQEKMGAYADILKPGIACPLCGSEEHPQVTKVEDVSQKMNAALEIKKKTEEETARQNELLLQTGKLDNEINTWMQELMRLRSQLSASEAEEHQHLSSFIWEDFERHNDAIFEEKKRTSTQAEQRIEALEIEVAAKKNEQSAIDLNIQKYKKGIEDFVSQKNELQGQLSQLRSQLHFSAPEHFYSENLDREIESLQHYITTTESQYKALSDQINLSKIEVAKWGSSVAHLQQTVLEIKHKRTALHDIIDQKIEASSFNNLKDIISLLNTPIDIEVSRKSITDFNQLLYNTQSNIQKLKQAIGAETFDAQHFQALEQQLDEEKKLFEKTGNDWALQQNELSEYKKKLQKKDELLKVQEALNIRDANLKIMTGLFKEKGFVKYISGIHLHNLCNVANQRFHRLTNNQLSLALNEKNDFEVIDYLNGGHRRSGKTLSGGQTFQASLCLALALAESVQTLNRFEKNFFFIDEGFGTLDKEAIDTVFQTLEELHKENRIVGIISHVEELQERIPKYLHITRDGEKGSIIETN